MPNTADTLYVVSGTVKNEKGGLGVPDLHVLVYDKDLLKDDFLGICVTDKQGAFSLQFEASKFKSFLDRRPDLYFIVKDAGLELLCTKDDPIKNAGVHTTGIDLTVDLTGDKLRELINPTPVPGWVGGFAETNKAFAYPDPDLGSLDMTGNLENIKKLQRQQKVVWPEFSWITPDGQRCYQMFAPDISRLGYTNEGQVYAIICPQQGACIPGLGCMNVEVTVTGVRGWADETAKDMAADMTVTGKIWFSPSAHENPLVQELWKNFQKNHMDFPFDKAHAINVTTHNPGHPDQPIFPLRRKSTTAFPIPDFARHESVAWDVAHLGVQIGPIEQGPDEKVNHFNQTVLNLFNIASGDMLKNTNILTWNVWFTAPELVDQAEWTAHAEKWRKSIDADHGSPDGPGTDPRFYDGTPFSPIKELFDDELKKIFELKASLE